MDGINQVVDAVLRGFFAAFRWAPPALPLTLLSAFAGVFMLWVISRTSDQEGVKAAKRRVHASLLELRVFADEPAVTWRAQKSLFASNLRYVSLSLQPAVWLALPIGLLLIHLESFYGRAPLPLARETVVTMGMARSWNPQSPAPQLAAPPEVEVEGLPVRVVDEHEISWRIRPKSECSGELRFVVDGQPVVQSIEAGALRRYVPGKSVRSALEALWHPAKRVRAAQVEWIEVPYPDATLTVFGLRVNWLVWFFAVSMLAAQLLKKSFGVVI
jgi:uncharacterized membrane protein (DUF106 family)